MHPTHIQWFGFFALIGMVVLTVFAVREARSNRRALPDPAWWFWVVILAGVLVGIMPYLLVHFLGLGR